MQHTLSFRRRLTLGALLLGAASLGQAKAIAPAPAKVEKIAGGFRFLEGPVYHPRGFLLFSDVNDNTIYLRHPNGEVEIRRRPSGHANGNALDEQNRLVSCSHDNGVVRDEGGGRLKVLASRYGGKRLNSPNDLAIWRDGSIYFTDPDYGLGKRTREQPVNGVYRLMPNGRLTLLLSDFAKPNGIAFSPDGTRLYVNDSDKLNLRVFAVARDGSLTGGNVLGEMPRQPGERGVPDGMKVDAQGNILTTGPGGIWIFGPNGRLLERIATPEAATNLAWGDADRKTLYITAGRGLYRLRRAVGGPAR